jgi:hypothetical protein
MPDAVFCTPATWAWWLKKLRAFLKFAARRDVSSVHAIERALGVPKKRFERPTLGFRERQVSVAWPASGFSVCLFRVDSRLLVISYIDVS